MIEHCGMWANSRLIPQPFGEHAHGSASVRVDLGFAPCPGFGKAEAMEDFDHQVDAHGGADYGDVDGFAAGLNGGRAAGRGAVDFAVGDEFFRHGDTKLM
jgi:hypothetical protein